MAHLCLFCFSFHFYEPLHVYYSVPVDRQYKRSGYILVYLVCIIIGWSDSTGMGGFGARLLEPFGYPATSRDMESLVLNETDDIDI